MSNKTDSNIYTVLFAIGMVIIVGSLLAFAASSLEPTISENKRLEKQQNILYAMGVNDNDESSANFISTEKAPEAFSKYITKQIVIQNGNVKEDNQAYLIDIKKEKSAAKSDVLKRRLPLFIGEKDGKTYYVAPIYGKGLWDAIWGYVSMDEDMVIQGAYFDHKGETPGLGANIKQRFFMDDFIGEHLLDESGNFRGITVSKSNADPVNNNKTDNEVDAIAGATITGDGVTAMIKSDLKLYAPYFKSLKNNN
jgi:Na+-transporting NADH:ubiquinone oxidoreductase subunit C